jgi:hypothetical protein
MLTQPLVMGHGCAWYDPTRILGYAGTESEFADRRIARRKEAARNLHIFGDGLSDETVKSTGLPSST